MAYRLEYRTAQAHRIRDKVSSWKKSNPAKNSSLHAKRRARHKSAVPAWYGEFDRFVISEAFDIAKARSASTGVEWEVDHMVPFAAKNACGLHCASNIQVIPAKLNSSKKNRMIFTEPLQWLGAI
jgi:hypothetical protein